MFVRSPFFVRCLLSVVIQALCIRAGAGDTFPEAIAVVLITRRAPCMSGEVGLGANKLPQSVTAGGPLWRISTWEVSTAVGGPLWEVVISCTTRETQQRCPVVKYVVVNKADDMTLSIHI